MLQLVYLLETSGTPLTLNLPCTYILFWFSSSWMQISASECFLVYSPSHNNSLLILEPLLKVLHVFISAIKMWIPGGNVFSFRFEYKHFSALHVLA